ncbi:MAG: GtrA family protein [Caldilineaceae bacterium]
MQQARVFVHTNRGEVKRFAKFATVGAAGAVTHFTIFNVLLQILRFSTYISNTFGFSAAVIQNFLLNRVWTFSEKRGQTAGSQLAQFTLVSVLGLLINMGVLATVRYALTPFWQQLFDGNLQMATLVGDNFALAVAIGVVMFWNFAVNRVWTFRH